MAASRKREATPVEKAEVRLIRRAGPMLRHPLVETASAAGKIGDQPPLLALSGAVMALGLLCRDVKLARTGARMTLAHMLATAGKSVGKDNIDRTRPYRSADGGRYKAEPGKSRDPGLRSFPSGHTAGAVAVAQAIRREYSGAPGLAAQGAAALIGLFQISRRAHFPTDVAAGALIGGVAEAAVAAGARAFWRARDAGR
ncbi:phosphatase PAP2 family protein [Sphingomonas sp.]|uniref:phosphatase PAP2 family protein n=1 Tax=Sphingomonas sp. TaxID=28214 RepID=UPI003B3A3BC5